MTAYVTREEFLAAMCVLEEGRSVHSMQEIAQAKEALKPIVRYQWPQIALIATCFAAIAFLALTLLPTWPHLATLFAAAFVGPLVGSLIMRISVVRPLFVPAGFQADDVTRASRYVFA